MFLNIGNRTLNLDTIQEIEWDYLDGKPNGCKIRMIEGRMTLQREDAAILEAAITAHNPVKVQTKAK